MISWAWLCHTYAKPVGSSDPAAFVYDGASSAVVNSSLISIELGAITLSLVNFQPPAARQHYGHDTPGVGRCGQLALDFTT